MSERKTVLFMLAEGSPTIWLSGEVESIDGPGQWQSVGNVTLHHTGCSPQETVLPEDSPLAGWFEDLVDWRVSII